MQDDVAPPRRRDARLLVAPFVEAFAAPHLTAPVRRAAPEIVQDLSRRGLSFFTSNEEILSRPDRICAVTVECPDGFATTVGVSVCNVRRPHRDAPARISMEFDAPRPASRPLAPIRRLSDGFYVPVRRRDAAGLVRALLGVDPDSAERRVADRIRVPIESEMIVQLEQGDRVIASVALADASPQGFGCFAPAGFGLPGVIDRARLLWKGRELLVRAVKTTIAEPVVVRGRAQTRLRLVLDGDAGPSSWDLPLWAGAHEFGVLRPSARAVGPQLVQAAMLAKEDLVVSEATTDQEREVARRLSHEAFVAEGDVDPVTCPLSDWVDPFDDQSVVWVARARDVIVGTLRFVRDGNTGLPHHRYCPESLWPTSGRRRVEATRLAVSRSYRPDVNARLGVVVLLIVFGVEWCVQERFEQLVMGARISHERFYRAIGLSPLSPEFPHARFGLPSRLYGLDLLSPDTLRRFRRLVR